LLILLAYGVAFAAASLGRSLLVFDDHPGQLYRLWHAVTYGPAPWAWNPGWWTGYPELQFYPPGFAYAGALVHTVLLGAASVGTTYQTLLWIVYLAPGVTAFALLARVLGNGWLALPGAFVALTLSAGVASGVEGGLHTGMVAARLGWALLPLLPCTLARFTEGDDDVPLAAVALLAAITLTHPAHLPAAVAFLLLAATARVEGRRTRLLRAARALAVAAAVTAFWTLPLLARLDHARALAWGTLSLPPAPFALALAVAALFVVRRRGCALERALARWPWLMAAVVLLDRLALEPLGFRWLPADRVVDGAWLAFVLAAGVAAGRGIERLAARGVARPPGMAFAGGEAVLGGAALALALSAPALTLWPRAGAWPSHAETERGLKLPALWAQLATAPPGRVLFVRSGVPLVHGTAWYRPHTHITALTPIATGRSIVHGTFTHPSPVAAYVYRGRTDGGPVDVLAEQLDGRSLFGRPLRDLHAVLDGGAADRLAIAVVVALEDDVPALAPLAEGGAFRRASRPPFVLYTRITAATLPRETSPNRWELAARGEGGAWVSARVAYYPLWRAASGGVPLPTRPGPAGDLEVRLDRPDPTLTLAYGPGIPEVAGMAVTAAAVLALIARALSRRRHSRAP
jgi:hypothetical protein